MGNIPRICSVQECDRIVRALGLCIYHYSKEKELTEDRICSIEGCPNKMSKRNWCNAHYLRWYLRGGVDILLQPKEFHGMANSKIYGIWSAMRDRCNNPNNAGHKWYFDRGIKVCKRWNDSFKAFYEDMGDKTTSKHSIDRINNDGNYSCGKCEECIENNWPMNCRWATATEQIHNQRKSSLHENNVSGYMGVRFDKSRCKWTAYVRFNNKAH